MSLRMKYETILTQLAPAGAVGVSLALGAAAPAVASEHPASDQPSATDREKVSERLAAVRDALSVLAENETAAAKAAGRLAWGNWGYGWGGGWGGGYNPWNNWHNWRNWGNWFRNW